MQTLPYQGFERAAPPLEPRKRGFGSGPLLPLSDRLARLATLLCVLGSTVFVIVQIRPGLIFGPGTDVGGDNAAHIDAAYFLIHHLLPRGQISGWDPQWFNGFPLYVFYFPLPAVIIAGLNPIFGYTVAFKIVTVLGTVFLPLAAYAFARLAGLRRPIPALAAVAMIPFIFNVSYTIDGGNLASTLAGEFSFTLSMTFGLLFLGVFARSLETGRLRWLAAILFTLTILSHVVPALFATGGAIALAVARRRWRFSARVLITALGVGGLMSAFWALRFAASLDYSSSMGYTKVGDALGNLFPPSAEVAIQVLAILGLFIGFARRDRVALVLAFLAVASALAFVVLPSGMVYNGRWLPFWFLTTSLLAAYAVGELAAIGFDQLRLSVLNEWITPVGAGLITLAVVAGYLGVLPGYATPAGSRNFIPDWVSWNYTGYQAKPGWGQYQQLLAMMLKAAKTYGCGRLDYEYSPNTNLVFGSTLVPMSFPYWTGGCIDSSEGLYYESSTSTPFHFLDQAELSIDPSNPVVGIPYQSLNIQDGIRHLQLTGTKYFLANSAEVEDEAASDPLLTEVASMPASANVVESSPVGTVGANSPRWVLYVIKNSPLVTPLTHAPVVESGMNKQAWQSLAISWYQSEENWPVPIVTTGPASWTREAPGALVPPDSSPTLPKTTVTNVTTTDSTISFDVSRTGVPIDVKIPYFPNWQASGATGPYLETPNLMVVVPTAHHVVLSYGTTTVDWLGRIATALGLGGLMILRQPLTPPSPSQASGEDEPYWPAPERPDSEVFEFGLPFDVPDTTRLQRHRDRRTTI